MSTSWGNNASNYAQRRTNWKVFCHPMHDSTNEIQVFWLWSGCLFSCHQVSWSFRCRHAGQPFASTLECVSGTVSSSRSVTEIVKTSQGVSPKTSPRHHVVRHHAAFCEFYACAAPVLAIYAHVLHSPQADLNTGLGIPKLSVPWNQCQRDQLNYLGA